jgi:PilZ domain
MMHDRRFDPRMSCSNHVRLEWQDPSLATGFAEGHLTDISLSGTRLQSTVPVPVLLPTRLIIGEWQLTGTIRYCFRSDGAFTVGVEFDPDSQRTAGAIMRAIRRPSPVPAA